jgi:hypothetical protein
MLSPKDTSVVYLEAKDRRGIFRIGTEGAKVDGKDTPPSQVFAELAKRGIPSERLGAKRKQ